MSARRGVCALKGSRGSTEVAFPPVSVTVGLTGSSIRATGSALTLATRPVLVRGDAVARMVEWRWMECASTVLMFVLKRDLTYPATTTPPIPAIVAQ